LKSIEVLQPRKKERREEKPNGVNPGEIQGSVWLIRSGDHPRTPTSFHSCKLLQTEYIGLIMDLVESESASEEDQKIWESDSHQVDAALPESDCGIGHRVLASRSVLALAVDEHCVFAGLQGGDIVVS
jgi:hypothetical protein